MQDAADSAQDELVVGREGEYHWLLQDSYDISALLQLCPDIVLGKRIAVTSIDSGTLLLSEEEKLAGWWTNEERKVIKGLPVGTVKRRENALVAYSPILDSIHRLPNETHDECCAGFDEWYVFDREPPACDLEVFVNWGGFRLDAENFQFAIDRFWRQMRELQPESYIADGTNFNFATRNAVIFDAVMNGLSKVKDESTPRATIHI